MGCILSTDESSCSTMFGNCANKHCQSACVKAAVEAMAPTVEPPEQVLETAIRNYLDANLRSAIEAHLSTAPLTAPTPVASPETVAQSPLIAPIPVNAVLPTIIEI